MILLVLAAMWGVYLFAWWRSRRERRGGNSIATFSRHLSVLERTSPARASLVSPPSAGGHGRVTTLYRPANLPEPNHHSLSLAEARRRRANILVALLGAAVVTLLFVPFLGAGMLYVHLVVDVLLLGYVALLVRARKLQSERAEKVRYLPAFGVAETPMALRRSAN
ncbi:MAG: hypothetical protein MUF83_07140 [Acidimicrobiales bacterium]|nr:hypothetical protein [Acidimicrobiales bacterium]